MSTTPFEPIDNMDVAGTLAEIRRRVAARLSRTVPGIPELAIPPLEPLRQARHVAEGWSGAMGIPNPRQPGLVSSVLQFFKGLMARSLRWFAFPQTQFNSGVVASLIRTEEMFADINRNLVVLGQNLVDMQEGTTVVLGLLRADLDRQEQRIASIAARAEEISLSAGRGIEQVSVASGKAVQEVSISVTKALESASVSVTASMKELSEGLNRGVAEAHAAASRIEQEYWKGFAQFKEEQATRQVAFDDEVRAIRHKMRALVEQAAPATPAAAQAATTPAGFDYPRFEEHFRGNEAEIRGRQEFYLPMLAQQAPVLDIACGRGEMLELLREKGIAAQGVDLDGDMVERCRVKKLPVEWIGALEYLEKQPDGAWGAIFSAQFVEHLSIADYSRLITLSKAKLRRGGRIILETQNPECLAIYSQTFYLDPTHVRPVPARQMQFLLLEAGFSNIEIKYLSPLRDALPQLPLWRASGDAEKATWNQAAERFNQTYFGHMDYAITAVKP